MTPARDKRRKQGASTAEAAAFFKIDPQSIPDWERKQWLVRFPDRSIDLNATAIRVDALRDPFIGGKPDRGIDPKPALASSQSASADGRAPEFVPDFGDVPAPDGDITYTEAHRRAEVAKALKGELEVAQLRGDLIPRDMAEATYCDVMAKVKANIEALPNRTAPLLLGLGEVADIRRVLATAIEEVLASVAEEAPEVKP